MSALVKALEIGRINVVREMRDRSSLFFVFVLPTIIIVALGVQFGGPQQARLGIVAPANDAAVDTLLASLQGGDVRFEIRRASDEAALRADVERGNLEAGLVVPPGYGASLAGTGTAQVRYLGTTESLTAGLRSPIEAAIARQSAVVTAARVAASAVPGAAGEPGVGTFERVLAVAEAGYGAVPGVTVEAVAAGSAGPFAGFRQFTLGAQSQLILFVFLTSMTAASQLVLSKRLGVSRRMVATPTSVGTIVVGEGLGRFGVAVIQAGYIVAVTAVLFDVAWGDPLAAGLLIGLFCLVAAAVALLVGALSRSADQSSSLGVFAGLALGAIGGCMIPIETMPEAMQSFARITPHAWAMTGLHALVRDGGGVASVLPNLAVLGGWVIALVVLASWRFREAITG